MFSSETVEELRSAIRDCAARDSRLLDALRAQVGALKGSSKPIHHRQTTSIALVASDGGNNRIQYDPFLIQVVRVVDSHGKQLCLDVVSPTTDTDALSAAQFNDQGESATALGRLMRDVDVAGGRISELAYGSIPDGETVRNRPDQVKPGWVQTYRDIWEWAVLYDRIVHERFATDTLLVRDGLLRAKFIRPPYFERMIERIDAAIERAWRDDRRRLYLVGLAKHSNVIERNRLAMTLENVLPGGSPRYLAIPDTIERDAYAWAEWTTDVQFSAGSLFIVRFGAHDGDPLWAVDILRHQVEHAQEIFGCLLADARDGFPVSLYPACLQRAHEHAAIVDWDLDIIQDALVDTVLRIVPEQRRDAVEAARLALDPARRRYS